MSLDLVIDLIIAGIFAVTVSVIPAYIVRYKLLKKPMSDRGAIFFCSLTFVLIYFAIALHSSISHPEIRSRPGQIFVLLVFIWVWKVVKKGDLSAAKIRAEKMAAIDAEWERSREKQKKTK